MSERIPKHGFEQKEIPTPRPGLLDIVEIDGKLAQVGPTVNSVVFLREKASTPEYVLHHVMWDEYNCDVVSSDVAALKKDGLISEDEFEAVYWGADRDDAYIKEHVTFFGRYTKK